MTAREVLEELTANNGEEYLRLHTDKQSFEISNAHMKYNESKALERLEQDLVGLLPERKDDYSQFQEGSATKEIEKMRGNYDYEEGFNQALSEVKNAIRNYVRGS